MQRIKIVDIDVAINLFTFCCLVAVKVAYLNLHMCLGEAGHVREFHVPRRMRLEAIR